MNLLRTSFIIFYLFIFYSTSVFSQNSLKNQYLLYEFYDNTGSFCFSHNQDQIKGAFKSFDFCLHAPIYTMSQHTFAIQSQLRTYSILGDKNISANLGLAWSLQMSRSLKLVSGLNFEYYQKELNFGSSMNNYSDPLLQYHRFSGYAFGATVGILQDYFWLLIDYTNTFPYSSEIETHRSQLNSNVGFRLESNDWMFLLPVEGYNLMYYNQDNITVGLMLSYKNNSVYAKSNFQGNLSIEFGIQPYKWLKLGVYFSINAVGDYNNLGFFGNYLWYPKALVY